MPIHPSIQLQDITDDDFNVIDEAVMRCAYASQNHFGQLFDERVYENDMAARLRAEGFDVQTQIPIKVAFGGFEKIYRLDLVVNQMVYELKVVESLIAEHEAQALHYAMLQDVRRVKLINLGSTQVRGKLLRNALTKLERFSPRLSPAQWTPLTSGCERLVGHLKELIKDWGTHLDSRLYNEALVHHFGGEGQCFHRANVTLGGQPLGTHLLQLHSPGHAFTTTAFSTFNPAYRRHLEMVLACTGLDAIQWLNLNRSRLEITTLLRKTAG